MGEYSYFHSIFDRVSNKLFNELDIDNGESSIKVRALWDTGATNSCISHNVVEKLSLSPEGMVNNYSVSGVSISNTYTVNIKLPNNIVI